jgi:SAM-dependent methyltransferase
MNVISRWFRGAGRGGETPPGAAAQRIIRRSNGLNELTGLLRTDESLRVLDLGPTSPQNISYLTGLGHRIHNEDLLLPSRDPSLLMPGEDDQPVMDVTRFMAENLVYDREFFDAVLCWDMPDYLHADLVKPVVQRLHSIVKPKGLLLGFFHTRDAGPDAPYHRYHITGPDTLELQRMSPLVPGREAPGRYGDIRLLRVFNNRHIENLFHDFTSIKFFLGRDNIREVLVVR